MSVRTISRRKAFILLATVVFAWGLTWPLMKLIVATVPPIWATAIRSALAAGVLIVALVGTRNLIVPPRGDLPVIASIALLHMVAFAALIAMGLALIPAGRSVVLGYTAPLWVVPGARLFLGERMTSRRGFGLALGCAGLALMFNPLTFDWHDSNALIGNGLILLAALCWAINIVHVRAHRWIATPFQLSFWEVLLATVVLFGLAFAVEGTPHIEWTAELALLFSITSVLGVALAFWAMASVNRSLPATTTSLGILATPVVGTLCSMALLGETADTTLIASMILILAGIAVGTTHAAGAGSR